MSGSPNDNEGWDLSTIFWLVVMAAFVIGALVLVGLMVKPKLEELFTPTPEPGTSQIFPVRHDPDFECSDLAIQLYAPTSESNVISALNNLDTSGALPGALDLESLEGWSAHWFFDTKQDRVEYWMYGGGESDGLVYEFTIGCMDIFGFVEFSEIEVRELSPAGEGNHN